MSKKNEEAIPQNLMKPVELKAPKKKNPEGEQGMSERERIELTTQLVLTHRVNDQFRASLNLIKTNMASRRYSVVDCVRLITLYTPTLDLEARHDMMQTMFYEEESLKKSSTTFAINRFTKLQIDECLQEMQDYAKKIGVRANVDASSFLNQSVAYFGTLSKDEMLKAEKVVKDKFGDLMVYLTPAQAKEALDSL